MENIYSVDSTVDELVLTIKKKIRELRKAQPDNPSQETFAKKADIPVVTFRKWESEKNNSAPDVKSLLRLCAAYNVDFDYFTGRLDAHDRDTDFVMEYTGLSEKTVLKLAEMKRSHYDATRVLDHLLQTEAPQDSYTGRLSANDGIFFLQSIANYFMERQLIDLLHEYSAGNAVERDRLGQPLQEPVSLAAKMSVMSYCSDHEKQKDIMEFHVQKDLFALLDTIYDSFSKQIPIDGAGIPDHDLSIWKHPYT